MLNWLWWEIAKAIVKRRTDDWNDDGTVFPTVESRYFVRQEDSSATVRHILACVSLCPQLCSVVNSAPALSTVASLSVLHVYQPTFEKMLLDHHASSRAVKNNRANARQEVALRTAALLHRFALLDNRKTDDHLKAREIVLDTRHRGA
jgi:hypothetical protein